MKKLIYVFLCVHSAWALAIDCDPLFIQHLTRGHEYDVRPTEAIRSETTDRVWSEQESKKLIFIGKMPREHGEDHYVFADRNRNTYYLSGRNSRANGYLVATLLVHANGRLPTMVKQTDGSCNVCAQVMAANAARARRGLLPLPFTGEQAETDEALQKFSYFEVIRQFVNKLYDMTWPKGFSPGEDPKLAIVQQIKALRELASQIKVQTTLSTDLQGNDLKTEKTKSAGQFFVHLQTGGTAVIGGGHDMQTPHLVTSEIWGSELQANHSALFPQPRGLMQNFRQARRRAHAMVDITKLIVDGIRPDETQIRKFAMDFTQVGHAIAAIGFMREGPLAGDIIAMNSWGTVELYRQEQIQDGLTFLLIK